MNIKLIITVLFLLIINIFDAFAQEDIKKNAITLYYGVGTNAHIEEIPTFSFEKRDAYFAGFTYNREFFRTKNYKEFSLEYEIGGYKHFGDFSSHQEATVAVMARFNKLFPENFFIDSFAVGEGLSLASQDPNFEAYLNAQNESNDFLNYLAFEFVFKVPTLKNTRFIYRLHHRSGVFGLFNDISGGSNYLSFGIRHKF